MEQKGRSQPLISDLDLGNAYKDSLPQSNSSQVMVHINFRSLWQKGHYPTESKLWNCRNRIKLLYLLHEIR